MKTEQQKENMRKHIAFLRDNADKIRASFDMSRIKHQCGTPACSLGFADVSIGGRGVFEYESVTDFSERIFGINPCSGFPSEENLGEYMFGARWVDTNNTPEAAAARMEAVLYNQVPKEWGYTAEFAHPVVDTLEPVFSHYQKAKVR